MRADRDTLAGLRVLQHRLALGAVGRQLARPERRVQGKADGSEHAPRRAFSELSDVRHLDANPRRLGRRVGTEVQGDLGSQPRHGRLQLVGVQ